MRSPADIAARLSRRVFLAVLVSLGVAVAVLENSLPGVFPWVRLGLANTVGLLALLWYGFPAALGVTLSRVVLASLISGGFPGPGFLLSLGGGSAAVLIMGVLAATRRLSPVGLSMGGAFAHTLTQFVLIGLLLPGGRSLLPASPPFLLVSIPAGAFVGWAVLQATRSMESAGWGPGDP
jgi:heptaprenyl diphosphate synthase